MFFAVVLPAVRPLSVRPLIPISSDAVSSYLVDEFQTKLVRNIYRV